ncbi:SMI1/KNR4 family protein [Streptomyces pactum]|uniref:SMI1/KNR4 family protein n=1 Tax=Streptomyces pactum TaxID=68249 RepID=A0ABS0NU41_9ACTN|nr:SMI1/KNR4 family protein [Streptomyces pactum]MBH5338724.1 SMI1/KNR4 family protein [Streptomyces pactum]
MVDQRTSSPPVYDFATWEPVLRLQLADAPEPPPGRPLRMAGRIHRHGWSLPRWGRRGRMTAAERDAVEHIRRALARAGAEEVVFSAEVRPDGRTTLRLVRPGPAVEGSPGYPVLGVLVLAEGSLPGPWRRLPDPVPGAGPAPSVDLELLERTLRERLPGAAGATEEEIAAAEARLGVTLPEELKVLYRVVRDRWEEGDDDAAARVTEAVGYELLPLRDLYRVDGAARHSRWEFSAKRAVITPPDAAVQGLAGSPGWIVFAGNGGDELAVDLTPGPRGHTGQVILVDHEQSIGAELVADSLTDLVVHRIRKEHRDRSGGGLPVVAAVGGHGLPTVRDAAHPDLEVLSVDVTDGAPFSLAPVTGLGRLRTLTARPGALADPLEIARLTGLEFLELGPRDWRALLDAGAVPRTLSAAVVGTDGDADPLHGVDIANELLALRNRPLISRTVLEGHLGPVA